MKKIISDVSNKRDLKENLAKYSVGMKNIYGRYAKVRLALNYYTYFQIELDDENKRDTLNSIAEDVNRVIRDAVLSSSMSIENAIEILDKDRAKILKEVSALTYYVDAFKIFEHALNRIEYKFRSDDYPTGYSDENLCRMLMQYILSDEDSVVVNSKICEVMAELPVRMTKNKFFEYVANGLSIYKGSEKGILNDFIYMIKTSAMLYTGEEFLGIYPELEEVYNVLKNTDYTNIEKEQYDMLNQSIIDISAYIEGVMNVSMMLMEIMNDTYSILLSGGNIEDDSVTKSCDEIVAIVNDYFILGSEIEEDTEELFFALEGSQEELYSKISMYNILDEIEVSCEKEIGEYGYSKEMDELKKLEILSSDSIFVDLDLSIDTQIVDDETLNLETEKLIDEFKSLFKDNGKNINRAVISTVLSQLPVFFNNISELQDYIFQALNSCTDKSEKLACIEVLHQIMEE